MKVTESCLTATRTRVSYRCLWVLNNSEPVKNWNQWECSTWWRTHKKLCSSVIISRYQGGNTRRKIDIGVAEMYWSAEEKYFTLSEKWNQRRSIMVGTTIAKDQFTDTRWYYIKEILIITRSFHDRIHIVSMGMNTKFKLDSHFSNA